jgi:hypothetical protein
MSLGRLSFLYTKQRGQTSLTKTRNRQPLIDCQRLIQHYVRIYSHARTCLQRLGLQEETLKTSYQEILKSHLSVNKDVTEEARHTQKNDKLAWFWRIGCSSSSKKQDSWDLESELIFIAWVSIVSNLHSKTCCLASRASKKGKVE